MRTFLSPGERDLLARLPAREAEIMRLLMDEFDAHLIPDEEPVVAFEPEQLKLRPPMNVRLPPDTLAP